MPTQLDRIVAQERRARLAAEHQLSQRQRDMRTATERMERRSRVLTEAILEKRAQLDEMQARVDRAKLLALETEQSLQATVSDRARVEAMLRQALNAVRDGFAIFDSDLRLVCANDPWLSIFDGLDAVRPGIALREICSLMVEEGIIDPRMPGREWVAQVCERYDRSPPPDMQIHMWSGRIITLSDRTIQGGGFVNLAVDQTDDLRLRGAIEAIPDPFALFDRDERLVTCNAPFRALSGVAADDAPDVAAEYSDPADDHRLRRFREAGDRPEDVAVEDGRWLRLTAVSTPDGGRAAIGTDITRLKHREAALQQARFAADAASGAKSAALDRISDELRAPISAILSLSELLSDDPLARAQRDMVLKIRNSAESMLTLINDIREASAIEEGCLDLNRGPFDLAECTREAVDLMRGPATARGIDIRLALDADLPPRLSGDADRVRQLLVNLLENAIRSTDRGNVAISISRVPADEGATGCIRIEVASGGPGLPRGAWEASFEPSRRAENGDALGHQGAELRLSVSRALVEMMGGTLGVHESSDRGTVIRATLDLPPVGVPEDGMAP